MVAEVIFWLAAGAVVYAYAGYPLVLVAATRLRSRPVAPPAGDVALPSLTLIVPAHNEADRIVRKIENTRALEYPAGRLETLFVSDGSTDATAALIRDGLDERSRLLELAERGGKAAALNAALQHARHEVVVFTDASIMLAPDALLQIARPFALPEIGCVSGEDHIEGGGGEGAYGRYELFLRRQESRLHSIVGASGSFYAQRRHLCDAFEPNLAPDFLSVLRTVQRGYRAIAEPAAVGTMTALADTGDEFRRKVRTILRGITTLVRFRSLLNPRVSGLFAFELLSHKLARWLVPFWLLCMLATSAYLAWGSVWYALLFAGQAVFFGLALAGLAPWRPLAGSLPARIALYFTAVNMATLSAWVKYAAGTRQELWSPSRR